jgi:rod shape-determining protein MreD
MSWPAFFVLSYVAVAMQSGLTPFLRLGADAPNFGLVALVFIAINAQRQAVLLAAFILGAMQDLATSQPFGLFAFSYGLAAVVLLGTARSVHRDHPLTHFFCVLLAGVVTAAVIIMHGIVHGERVGGIATFGAALYTAVLAPFLLGGLKQVRGLFAFTR